MPYSDLAKGRHSEKGRPYFVTTVLAERARCCFLDFIAARLVIAEMQALDQQGAVHSLAWVVMPDHVHWLFELRECMMLSSVVKTFKARSARRVNDRLGRRGALWQRAYYDHAIREADDIRGIARYIVANPLRSGLVEHIGDYPHWDAVWL